MVYVAIAGFSFEKYIRNHESSQSVILSSTTSASQLNSPVGPSHTIAGKSITPMKTNTKQAESYLTVSHSISSHTATGDTAVLPTSGAIVLQHSEKFVGPTSHVLPVTTSASSLTQPDFKERSQVTDDGHRNTGKNITKDAISE